MLRTCANLLKQRSSQMLISARFTGNNPESGSINAAQDKFSEREKALENNYFRKQNEQVLAQLRKRHEELEKQSDDIDKEQERIESEIKKLEQKKEEILKKGKKPKKP